jgi:hypothetical protein
MIDLIRGPEYRSEYGVDISARGRFGRQGSRHLPYLMHIQVLCRGPDHNEEAGQDFLDPFLRIILKTIFSTVRYASYKPSISLAGNTCLHIGRSGGKKRVARRISSLLQELNSYGGHSFNVWNSLSQIKVSLTCLTTSISHVFATGYGYCCID